MRPCRSWRPSAAHRRARNSAQAGSNFDAEDAAQRIAPEGGDVARKHASAASDDDEHSEPPPPSFERQPPRAAPTSATPIPKR